MLSLLKIENIALIDRLEVEFGTGLNLLTGETGSGKSIIVDSLGALTGDRVSTDLIKAGEDAARIEGLFSVENSPELNGILDGAGLDIEPGEEIIVRREISLTGKNRVFINSQLATQTLLKKLGALLVDIHGQGEQAALYDVRSHIAMLDGFAGVSKELSAVSDAYSHWSAIRDEVAALDRNESEKLQLLDILRFQANEISAAGLKPGEEEELDDEKRRLANVEKLAALSTDAYALLYDDERSTLATLDKAAKLIEELSEYDARFRGFEEQLNSARAVIDELGGTARDFSATLEASPERLNEVEDRLAEITRLKRKYGDSIDAVLEHLAETSRRLESIETAEFRREELVKQLAAAEKDYAAAAGLLHDARIKAAAKFAKAVETELSDVALEKAKFEVRVEAVDTVTASGSDRVEFYFSANPGEPVKPLSKVASGGEASRLMLVLKTVARQKDGGKTAVFDEIDIGIGGRVAEAVGRKLKALSVETQVFCVTHQPQIASLADHHFVVEKEAARGKTSVRVRELDAKGRIDEIARMLAGEQITEAARENAKTMLASAK